MDAEDGSGTDSSTGFKMGRKSSWSACANFAAVRKDMLTSPESTFVTYGRETFIRLASAVCERPRAFIRRISFLRNAEPILSIAFTPYSVTDLLRGCQGYSVGEHISPRIYPSHTRRSSSAANPARR